MHRVCYEWDHSYGFAFNFAAPAHSEELLQKVLGVIAGLQSFFDIVPGPAAFQRVIPGYFAVPKHNDTILLKS